MILLVAECLALGLLILAIHYFGRSLAPTLLLAYVAAIQFVQNLFASSVFLELANGILVSPGSAVLFPSTFLVLLLVAVRGGHGEARKILYGILLANLLLTLTLGGGKLARSAGLVLIEQGQWIDTFRVPTYLIGTGLLLLDVLLLLMLEQALASLRVRLPLRLLANLLIICSFDSVVFVLASPDVPIALLPGQLLGKSVAGLVYGSLLIAYLYTVSKPHRQDRLPAGRGFAILTDPAAREPLLALSSSLRLVLPAVVLTGVASTSLIFALSRQGENEQLMSTFMRDSEERFSAITAGVAHNVRSLVALESLYVLDSPISQDVFGSFVRHVLEHDKTIRALEWAPRVTAEERERFEASQRRAGNPEFQITERTPKGRLRRAGDRPVYFPITFVEPLTGNEAAIGFDMTSDAGRLATLQQAAAGDIVALGPVNLVQAPGETGFIIHSPVFRDKPGVEGERQIDGLIIGKFAVRTVVDAALEPLKPRGIDLALYDVSESEDERLLHFHASRLPPRGRVPGVAIQELHDEFRTSRELAVADRRWRIVATPTTAYLAGGRTWLPWGFLLAGLLATGLLAVYLVLLARSSDMARRLGQKIEQSEQRYRGLVDISFDGVATTENARIVEASQEFAETFGYSVEELPGMPVPVLVAPESQADVMEKIRCGYDKPYEALCVRRDGTRFPVEVSGKTVPYGDRVARVAAVRDISERKRAEAELLALERRYRELFQEAPEMYVVTTPAGGVPVVSECNESFLQTLGYTREEVVGRPLGDFYTEESRRQLIEEGDYQKALQGELLHKERQLVTRSGQVIDTVLRAAPERDTQNRVIGTRAIYVDITERKHTENLVLQSRERLRRLAERLQTVREEERKSLARHMHDELGQALTSCRFDLCWMQEKLVQEPLLATRVASMIATIDSLIDTVRDLSMRLRPHVLDTLGLAAAIEWEAEQFEERSRIACTCDVSTVSADLEKALGADGSTAVFRIFQEALTNVARHAEAARVDVALAGSASGLELEVLDDGKGIRDDQVADVHSSGLIGIRERAGALGGKVVIGRRPEGGTRLWVRIPL